MKNNIIIAVIGVIIGSIITSIVFITIIPTGPKDFSIVPEFNDVKNIIINGEKLTALQFSERYCYNKPKHTLKDESYCGTAMDQASIEVKEKRGGDRWGK